MNFVRKVCYDTWREHRLHIEKSPEKSHIVPTSFSSYSVNTLLNLAKIAIRPQQIRNLFERVSRSVDIKRSHIFYDSLPPGLDGFKVLHLSDFHIDCNPGLIESVIQKIPKEEYDLVVFTGDYQDKYDLRPSEIKEPLKSLIDAVQARHGIIATLGNHDNADSKDVLEDLGCRVLVNESVEIEHENEILNITGLDDVHSFFTEDARKALKKNKEEQFSIVAVHSPEIYHEAASAGHQLYLCGHTHGGQICLPGRIPIVSHSTAPQFMNHGMWDYGSMIGHTSPGLGTSTIPIRLFCPAEISILVLRQSGPIIEPL